MRKIIAISVMLVLLTSAAFAADVSGAVNGTVTVLQGDNGDGSKVTSGGGLDRIRVEASGSNEGKDFGGWIRIEPPSSSLDFEADDPGDFFSFSNGMNAYAWWKPMNELKLIVGGNPDGFYGKDGITRWMFYQTASDVGVTNPGNAWGGGYGGGAADAYGVFGNAFWGGYGGRAAMLEITPNEMVGINLVLPFFDGGETSDVFKHTTAQLAFKLDFGNIAVTYIGASGEGEDQAKIYAYFGGNFDALGLDIGLGYEMAHKDPKAAQPIWVGAGIKYGTDAFGVKVRAMAGLAGDDKMTHIRADVLPFFILSDSLRAYISVGLGMAMAEGQSIKDWHFNPYLEVGQEWGPKFLFGIKAWSENDGDITKWAVPIGLEVSF